MNDPLSVNGLDGSRRFMVFLGRDTTGSLAIKSFPAWMRLFGTDCELVGVNMPPDSVDKVYVNLVARLRSLNGCIGMLVTSHKVRLYEAAHLHFDSCSSEVNQLEEVGGVIVSDERLIAVSPDAVGIMGELREHIDTGSAVDVVLLGGGGAARAIALVASMFSNVRRIAVTEIDPERRHDLQRWVDGLQAQGVCNLVEVLPDNANEELVSTAAEGALIVNASGMGKDVAGSPVSNEIKFPRGSVVWDLNYRGELAFLDRACNQAERRELLVMDGFSLFVRNWTWLLESCLEKRLNDEARKMLWQTTQLIRNRD